MASPQAEQDDAQASPARGARGWLTDMAAAVALLSILPVPGRWQAGADWPRALRALPMVGVGIGLASAAAWWLAHEAAGLHGLAAALLALLTGVVASGALHEDGLADFADGLGGRTRQRRLEIMRDARIGGFGVLALMFAVGLQVAALLALGERGALAVLVALVLAHAASRLASAWLMHALPHAREDGMSAGTGRPDGTVLAQAALPVVALLAVAALAGVFANRALPAAFIAGNLLALSFARMCRRLLGGQTGDAAGALEVMTRTVVLLALSAG